MFNVLVTGSNGFIGKNLINELKKNSGINILEFQRHNTVEELKELLAQSDLVFHLAGEVRPTSSSEDFERSNVTLTKSIIDILAQKKRYIPILYASSIHAKLSKNDYGKTKRESEILIEDYLKKHAVRCTIYRLPHVFGEGCKPNYNSVISTWIYNSIMDLDINVFDRDIQMNYVYVQDIVKEFSHFIDNTMTNDLYMEPKTTYHTTLGDVVDYITEFKENIEKNDYQVSGDEFKEKLFKTYKYYWKQYNKEIMK